MTKLLVIGDPHCGAGLSIGKQSMGSALNSRITDQVNLLDWCLDRAIQENVTDIIVTGDVFEDPKPSIPIITMFIDWLQKCVTNNKSVHIVVGNHDVLRSGQFYTSPLDIISSSDIDNVFIYNRTDTIHLDGISVTFLPFRDRRSFNLDSYSEAVSIITNQLVYELNSIPLESKKILIGHLALEGSIPIGYELDDLKNELLITLDAFNGYDVVIMGHIHKHQIMREVPHIAHIGSMDISNFGEAEQKKYIAIIDNIKTIDYMEIPTRPLVKIDIDIPEKEDPMHFIEEFLSKDKLSLDRSISRVSLKLSNSQSALLDRKKIESLLYEKGVFHTTKIGEEKRTESVKKENAPIFDNTVNEASAIEMYASLLEDKSIKNEFIRLSTEIVKEAKIGSN